MFTSSLVLILAMVSIQTGASFAKGLFPVAGPAGATALRLIFATLILWPIWRPWRFKLPPLKDLFLYGTSLGLMNLTFYFALQRIPLGLAVALEFMGPLALTIFSSRRKIDFFWAILAGVGIFLLLPKNDLTASAADPIGMMWALIAGTFWALYIYFGQRAGKDLHGGIATTIGMTFAALAALPFGLIMDGPKLLNLSILPMGILVGALSSALPYSLEMYALKKMPIRTFGIFMSLEPAVAGVVGLIFLKEALTVTQWCAIGCVISASLGSTLSIKR